MNKLPTIKIEDRVFIVDSVTYEYISTEDLVFMYNILAIKFNKAIEEFENRND